MALRLSAEIHHLFSTFLDDSIIGKDSRSHISDIDERNVQVEDVDENDKDEDSITDDDVWSKSGSLREFLSDYENIINGTNQGRQASERTGESGYRSESAAYEETVSTTRYTDSTTPEFSSPIRNTSYYNPSISVHLPVDSTFTTETTITTTTAIKKIASGSKGTDDTAVAWKI